MTENREEKVERTRQAAERRTSNALRDIERIGKLASSPNYEFEPEWVEEMFASLNQAIQQAEAAFHGKLSKKRFSLEDKGEKYNENN